MPCLHKLFFDFEFDNYLDMPVSFGMCGGGNLDVEFYREFKEPLLGFKSQFVLDTVLPLLSGSEDKRISPGILGSEITQFMLELCEKKRINPSSIVLICDSKEDVRYLERYCGNVFQVECVTLNGYHEEDVYMSAYESAFDPVLLPRHHALNDAMAMKIAYETLAEHRFLNIAMKQDMTRCMVAAA